LLLIERKPEDVKEFAHLVRLYILIKDFASLK